MTGPVGIEIEETEGADLGRVEAGHAQVCDQCGGASYTGPRCTRCTFASRPSPPWPVGREGLDAPGATEAVSAHTVQGPEFVCPASGCDHFIPQPVVDLAVLAISWGWQVERRHSRGKPAGARTVSDLWSVRFRRPGWAGYAVRVGDAWKSVAVSGSTLPPFLALGVTELREWLEQPERAPEWYAKIVKRVANSALASKIRACPGPERCTLHLVALAFVPFGVEPVWADHTHRANGDIKIKNSKKEKASGL